MLANPLNVVHRISSCSLLHKMYGMLLMVGGHADAMFIWLGPWFCLMLAPVWHHVQFLCM